MLPEGVFELTPRDTASDLWGPVFFNQSLTQNAAEISFTVTFPEDRALNLRHIGFSADPGALVAVARVQVGIRERVNQNRIANLGFFIGDATPPNGKAILGNMPTDFILLGRHHLLTADVTFTAADANNNASLSLIGLLVPIGNASLF